MRLSRRPILAALAFLAAGLAACATPPDTGVEQQLVDQARATVAKLRDDPDFPTLNQALARAKGVLVVPSLIKAGLIVGGEGGGGVLLGRDAQGEWSYPAFYTIGSGSFGFQAGVQDAEVVFTIMNDRALRQVIDTQFKLGADASLALGPKGMGLEAATTFNFGADVYAFAKTRGAYGGGTFEGSVIYKRDSRNRNYYGQAATANDIVIERKYSNPNADALRAALAPR
ncbi:MAG: lipid-binding SYLF domain-containing protein [Rhodospirillales bacterium]|nr:lipid-binding SYLF domain-containing protein [Rhodospirillales bacterium]